MTNDHVSGQLDLGTRTTTASFQMLGTSDKNGMKDWIQALSS